MQEINVRYWYTDQDISDYVDIILQHKLKQKLKDHHYLLAGIGDDGCLPDEDGNRYFVAITSAIDRVSHAAPLDLWLDKSKQVAPDRGKPDDRRDVWDEVMPVICNHKQAHVKILFAYNDTLIHWLTGEIQIHKVDHHYDITLMAHDPYGQGQVDEANFKILCIAIEKRIHQFNGQATFKFSQQSSPYGRRQQIGDGASCGVVTAQDIIKRITGASLNQAQPYLDGAKELREKHLKAFKDYLLEINATRRLFIQRTTNTQQPKATLAKASGDLIPTLHMLSEDAKTKIMQMVSLITGIKNESLQQSIIAAISENYVPNLEEEAYLVGVETAISQAPVVLMSQGIVLNAQDKAYINELYYQLFIDIQGFQGSAPFIREIANYLETPMGKEDVKSKAESLAAEDLTEQIEFIREGIEENNLIQAIKVITSPNDYTREQQDVLIFISELYEQPEPGKYQLPGAILEELTNDNKAVVDYALNWNLFYAASHQQIDIFKILIEEHDKEINEIDGFGQTCLHKAVNANDDTLCAYLLEHKADPSIQDNNGRRAFQTSYPSVITYDTKTSFFKTPFPLANFYKKQNDINALIEKFKIKTFWVYDCEKQPYINLDIEKTLPDLYVVVEFTKPVCESMAKVKCNSIAKELKTILQLEHIKVVVKSEALSLEAAKTLIDIIPIAQAQDELLTKVKAEIQKIGLMTIAVDQFAAALDLASKFTIKQQEALTKLGQWYFDIVPSNIASKQTIYAMLNNSEKKIIDYASSWNQFNCARVKSLQAPIIMQLLINNGINVNEQDKIHGGYCLHYACFNQQWDMCVLLLKYGANPQLKDKNNLLAFFDKTEPFIQQKEKQLLELPERKGLSYSSKFRLTNKQPKDHIFVKPLITNDQQKLNMAPEEVVSDPNYKILQRIFYFFDAKTLISVAPRINKTWLKIANETIKDLDQLEEALKSYEQPIDKAAIIYQIIQFKFKLFQVRTTIQFKDEIIKEILQKYFTTATKRFNLLEDMKPRFHQKCFDHVGLKDRLTKLIDLTKADLDKARNKGSRHPDKVSTADMLATLEYDYKRFARVLGLETVQPFPKRQPIWNEERLWLEQYEWCGDEDTKKAWLSFLNTLENLARDEEWAIPGQVFVTYAWSDEAHEKIEYWINPFLIRLREDLSSAGIAVKLDRIDNKSGQSIYNYMEQGIKESDYILVIGTASLLVKHQAKTSAVATELVLANRKRRRVGDVVFPILLSGSFEESFPAYFELYSTIRDWQSNTYAYNLMLLIRDIFDVGPDELNYITAWKEFSSQPTHKGLAVKGLTKEEVAKRIEANKELAQKQKELYAKEAEERHQKQLGENYFQLEKSAKTLLTPKISETSVAASYFSVPLIWNVPKQNMQFTGRTNILDDLKSYLDKNIYCTVTQAITGLGGVGKTQLVKHYAHLYKKHYQIIWWFDAASDIDEQYKLLAINLNENRLALKLDKEIIIEGIDLKIVRENVKEKLRKISNWLLIFDNAKPIKKFDLLYFPQQHIYIGHILITSRDVNWPQTKKLGPFSDIDALDFIKNTLLEDKFDEDKAKELAYKMGYFPLALAQAIAYINKSPNITLENYISLFDKRRSQLWAREESIHESEQLAPYDNYEFTVKATLDLSLEEIKKSKCAIDLLNFIAFLHNNSIPEDLLTSWFKYKKYDIDFDFSEALSELSKHSILETKLASNANIEGVMNTYSIHELVQKIIQDDIQGEAENWICLDIEIIEKLITYKKEGDNKISFNVIYYDHASLLIDNALKRNIFSNKLVNIIIKLSSYQIYDRHNYKIAICILKNIIENFLTSINEYNLVDIYKLLAIAYFFSGDYDPIKKCIEAIFDINNRLYGSDNTNTAFYYMMQAHMEFRYERYENAKENYQKSYNIYLSCESETSPEIIMTLQGLSNSFSMMGKIAEAEYSKKYFIEAEKYFEKTIKLAVAYYGSSNHPKIAYTLHGYATLLLHEKRYSEAELKLNESLSIRKLIYSDEIHPEIAGAFRVLGNILFAQEKYEEAKVQYEKSLFIKEKLYHDLHIELAASLECLGNVYCVLNRFNEAKTIFSRALKIKEIFYKDDTLNSNIVKIRNKLNDIDEKLDAKSLTPGI